MTDALPDETPEITENEKEIRACDWADYRKNFGENPDEKANHHDHRMFCAGWDAGRRSALQSRLGYLITPHGEKIPIPSHVAAQIQSITYKGDLPVLVEVGGDPGPYEGQERVTQNPGYTPERMREALAVASSILKNRIRNGFTNNKIVDDVQILENLRDSIVVPDRSEKGTAWYAIAHAESLEEAVQLAIGAASTCWETLAGAGIFDSDRALKISDTLVKYVRDYADEKDGDGESIFNDDVPTQAEEPVEHRLHRAFLNGYTEGSLRAVFDRRWDHS